MGRIGEYKTTKFSKNRKVITLVLHEGWKRHTIHSMVEFDITESKNRIKEYYKQTGTKISLTAWITKCAAQTLVEDPTMNSLRNGRNKIVTFKDVDAGIAIEREVDGEVRPLPLIIRQSDQKDVFEITDEIRAAQHQEIEPSTQVLGEKLSDFEQFATKAPLWLKSLFLRWFRKKGLLKKKHMGTLGITTIGMKGDFPGWCIPQGGSQAFVILVGGIVRKPGVVGDEIKIREYMKITVSIDHDVIDGGPMVRFIERFGSHLKTGYGLPKVNP